MKQSELTDLDLLILLYMPVTEDNLAAMPLEDLETLREAMRVLVEVGL